MKHEGYNSNSLQPNYKYKYNGKEYQDELGLNVTAMDYRQYDNAIGRFNSIDALSELDYDKSPYSFARDNPVVFGDPTGLSAESEYNTNDELDQDPHFDHAPGVFGQTVAESDMTSGTPMGGELREATVKNSFKEGYDPYGRIDNDSDGYDRETLREINFDINNRTFNNYKEILNTSLAEVSLFTNTVEKIAEKQIINGFKAGDDVLESLKDFKSLDGLRGANKLLQRAGYVGLAIDGLQLASKMKDNTAENSDYLRFGINTTLTVIAISNPVGILAVGAYSVFDYYYGDEFWQKTGVDN